MLLFLLALLSSSVGLAVAQQPCSTATSGLPTSNGQYTLSNSTFPSAIVSAWPEYSVGQSAIAYTVSPLTDLNGNSYAAGSWVWFGTQPVVSISNNSGQTWGLLNNSASDYPTGQGTALCAHRASYNRFYVMGDTNGGSPTSNSYVYASSNGELWTNVLSAATNTLWQTRALQLTGCVVDKTDNVYSLGENDIFMSSSQGVSWSNISSTSIYTPRSSFGYGIFSASYGDVMVVLGGSAGIPTSYGAYQLDVWVSQTGGRSWIQVLVNAPWAGRTEPNLAIASSGTMILQGGRSYSNGTQIWLSDVWVSFNGGALWQLLTATTPLNRAGAAVAFDSNGYLYLFAGEGVGYGWTKDGWKSTYALNNIQSWAAGAANQSLVIPSTFQVCSPYFNLINATAASTGGSGGPSSSAPVLVTGTTVRPTSSAPVFTSTGAATASPTSSAPVVTSTSTPTAPVFTSTATSPQTGNSAQEGRTLSVGVLVAAALAMAMAL